MKNLSTIFYVFIAIYMSMSSVGLWASAKQDHVGGIAAVVNDKPISKSELEARIAMAILSAGMDKNQQTHDYLAPQVLDMMISEELQLHRTEHFKLEVSPAEIDLAIGNIEQRNGMTKNQLKETFTANNIPFAAMEKHIKASIAWREYIRERYEALVQVTEEEIQRYLNELQMAQQEPQVMLAEIFLSFDSSATEVRVKSNAMKMIEKLRQGAHFSALAQEFSSAPSAARGGDIGWIAASRLEPGIQEAVLKTATGELTEPVRTPYGYHIIFVRDRRAAGESIGKDTLLTFNQVLYAFSAQPTNSEVERAVMRLKGLGDNAKSCSMMATLSQNDRNIQLQKVNKASMREMPAELRTLLTSLQIGQASKPVLTESGALVFMLCEKEEINPQQPSYDEAKGLLMDRKLASLAEREMRTVRRSAHIVIPKS